MRSIRNSSISFASLFLFACVGASDLESSTESALVTGTPEADAVLALINDPATTFETLDDRAGLDRRAARRIIDQRNGADGLAGTADDALFTTIEQLDAVAYVGASALRRLLDYAREAGYLDSGDQPTAEARERAILAVVNDPQITFEKLDDEVGLDRRAARNIIAARPFATLAELDAVSYVADTALQAIFDYAVANGYLNAGPRKTNDVIFSPNIYAQSHNVRVASLIDQARTSLDIAMYSFSDAGISEALDRAVRRGVKVRFVFETASEDRKLAVADRWNSKSGRLEAIGINVRWVNKIMHHKYVIIDGPRDDLAKAETGTLVTGSGNWSNGAATRYDENTLFLTGYPELLLKFQRQFNLLWDNSKDFEHVALPYERATAVITDANIPDDASVDVYYTSDNFSVSNTTFRIRTGKNTVSDALVAAIGNATESILVASGHLRSRPVAEALIAKRLANPNMDIRVLLDSQEWISTWLHDLQERERQDCLAAANGSASAIRKCDDKGFAFGYLVGVSGIAVRYKYYAYRWHYSYALQMHHKLMIIDGDEVWTGSYNLSDNAEHNTFENMIVFRGAEHASLVARYVANFEYLWTLERDSSARADTLDEINTSSRIPLVFTPVTQTWSEVDEIRQAVRANCADINTETYRTEPEKHRVCNR